VDRGYPAAQMVRSRVKRPPFARLVWVVGILAAVIMIVIATSFDRTQNTQGNTKVITAETGTRYRPPSPFHPNNANVPALVAYAVDTGSTLGLAKRPTVSCANHRCSIAYEVGSPPTQDFDSELVLPTRRIFKSMFDNNLFERASIVVSGTAVAIDGTKHHVTFFRIACNRDEARGMNWDTVSRTRLEGRCDYKRLAG